MAGMEEFGGMEPLDSGQDCGVNTSFFFFPYAVQHVSSFPGGLDGKESACNVGDSDSIPGLGRSPGEGHGYPLQYSCLENPVDRRAWQATVHGVAKTQTGLSDSHCYCSLHGILVP